MKKLKMGLSVPSPLRLVLDFVFNLVSLFRYKKQELPNPEFMTKLAKEGYQRGPDSEYSSQEQHSQKMVDY